MSENQSTTSQPPEAGVGGSGKETLPMGGWRQRRRWVWLGGTALAVVLGFVWLRPSPSRGTRPANGGKGGKAAAWNSEPAGPLLTEAKAGAFVQEVVERGEVESSSNVEIRCEVQSRQVAGTPIIEIVAEGSYVKEGDFLVKLDDAGLQAELVQQQITANTSRSMVVEAQADFDAAKLALDEYESGTFRQEEGAMEGDQFVARENLRRAEEYLRYSQKLAQRGYVTEVQLEADRFAVEKARKELESSTTKLEVLRRFTKVKTLNRLKAGLETAEAKLRARKNSFALDEERLKNLEDQLAKCVIRAPSSGQVVYANPATGDPVIAEGKMVRERQLIIRLPDPKRMQVNARVNESRIDRVKVGMLTRVRLDAFPSMELMGRVRAVSEYPLPQASVYSLTKEYGAEVDIEDPPAGVRTGMTAQVSIEVQRREEALQIPIQAVLERGDRFFCLMPVKNGLVPREVAVGASNDQNVVVEDGLAAGDKVLLAPQSYEDQVQLPAAPPKKKVTKTSKEPREPSQAPAGPAKPRGVLSRTEAGASKTRVAGAPKPEKRAGVQAASLP
ncbi:MAG: Macrolide export protein MacA [Verrucomicrobiota bacterium]|jgi:RND family efflux transporter MFP subunit